MGNEPPFNSAHEPIVFGPDRTRGQVRGEGTLIWWVARLRRAVDTGVITRDEAEHAMRRMAAAA